MKLDETDVKQAFEDANQVLAGRPFATVVAALQDLLVAALCYACPNAQEAKSLCTEIGEDLQKTIDKHFDHYHSRKNASTAAKRRSH